MPCMMWKMWNDRELHALMCEGMNYQTPKGMSSEDEIECVDDWEAFDKFCSEIYPSKMFRRSYNGLNEAYETYIHSPIHGNPCINGEEIHPSEVFTTLASTMITNYSIECDTEFFEKYAGWWLKNKKEDVDAP